MAAEIRQRLRLAGQKTGASMRPRRMAAEMWALTTTTDAPVCALQ